MFSSFLAFAALFAVALADPTPTGPAPGATFNEGTQCTVQWTADTSGSQTWKTLNIQLMTGDNYNMIPLSTVGTVDGTDSTKNSLSYPCLKVTPNAPIYFYQFSSPNSPNLYWTGRFTLAGPNGESVPAPNKTQPGTGASIPWGAGKLQDPSQATPPPSMGGGSTPSSSSGALPGAPSGSASASGSGSGSSAPTTTPSAGSSSSSTTSGMLTLNMPSSTSTPGTGSATTAGAAAAASSGAAAKDQVRTNTAVITAIFSLFIAALS